MDGWIQANAHAFRGVTLETIAAEGHSLEWTSLHKQFTEAFDSQLEEFVASAGTTVDVFLAEAKAAGEVPEAVLLIILAISEYDTWLNLMIDAANAE